jgi:hypothetical protein
LLRAIAAARQFQSQTGFLGEGSSCFFVETVLGPPVLGFSWRGGLPRLNLTGEAGGQYGVQVGTSLKSGNNWQSLTNVVLTNTEQSSSDPAAAPQRFYRAVVSK